VALAAALFALALGVGPRASLSIARNATAEVVVAKAIVLGIDFQPNDASSARPAAEDVAAFQRAHTWLWLKSQLEVPDDTVAEPPADLRTYLDDRREAIEAIVSALEKEPPVWSEPEKSDQAHADLIMASIRLQPILLSAALVAVRRADAPAAERMLEGSWSFARTQRWPLADNAARLQAGALRKLPTSPPAWIDRLSGDRWSAALDACAGEMADGRFKGLETSDPAWKELFEKAPSALFDGLRKLGPCEAVALDEAGLWKLVERELPASSNDQTSAIRRNYREVFLPTFADAVRRGAQVAVDEELTLEILRLRLEKDQDPRGRWPAELANPVSVICPSAGYVYRADRNGMSIRFEGAPDGSGTGFQLPLEFRSAYPAKRPESTPAGPALTPTPAGGMIAPP